MIAFFKVHFFRRRSVLLFIFSGAIQYLIDVILFGLLYSLGVEYKLSNVLSKVLTGFFGFFFNGYIVFNTFKGCDIKHLIASFFKFICLLAFLTFLSTLTISFFVASLPNSSEYIVFIKCITEIIMAFFSFFIQKALVYKL